jgi:hypothetical protein
MDAVLAAVGSSGVAEALRASRLAYPLVNATHILGIGLLIGSIAALDARILGYRRSVALGDVARLLLPVTISGLVLAVTAGALMFTVKPQDYAANPVFLTKLGLVALAVANALSLRLRPAWRAVFAGGPVTPGLRLSAALSLVLWLAVLVAGRMIAFFG